MDRPDAGASCATVQGVGHANPASLRLPLALLCAAGLAAADGGLKVARRPVASGPDVADHGCASVPRCVGTPLARPAQPDVGRGRSGLAPAAPASAATTTSPKDLADAAAAAQRLSRQRRAADPPAGRVAVRPGLVSRARRASAEPGWRRCACPSRRPSADISAMPYLGIGYSDYLAEDGLGLLGRHRPGGAEPGQRRWAGPRAVGHRRASTTWCASCACRRCCSWASTTRSDAPVARARGLGGSAGPPARFAV